MELVRRVRTRISHHNVSMISAGVAFYAMLAIFPTLIAVVSIYALVADPHQISRQLQPVTRALPTGAGDLLTGQLTAAAQSGHGSLTIGLVVSLVGTVWAASGGINALNQGLAIIYDVQHERSFIKQRVLSLGMTLGALLIAAITLGLIAAFPVVLNHIGLGPTAALGAQVARWVLLVLLVAAAIATLYRIPARGETHKLRFVSRGVLTAVGLWVIGSIGFSVYVSNFGSYNKTYGSLAAVIVLLLWLYLSAYAILLGAVVDAELGGATEAVRRPARHGQAIPAR